MHWLIKEKSKAGRFSIHPVLLNRITVTDPMHNIRVMFTNSIDDVSSEAAEVASTKTSAYKKEANREGG